MQEKSWKITISQTVKHDIKAGQWNLRGLRATISENENYLIHQIHRKNISLPLLYTLTVYLKINMFEPFLSLLPENVRSTKRRRIAGRN